MCNATNGILASPFNCRQQWIELFTVVVQLTIAASDKAVRDSETKNDMEVTVKVRSNDEQARLLTRPSSGTDLQHVIIRDTFVPTPNSGCLSASVEVVALFFFFSKILSDTLVTNFLEYVTCKVVYKYNDSMCTDPVPTKVENLIQPIVANIMMLRVFLESLFPSFFVLFVGPWSDNNGRKTVLMISLAGLSCSYALWGVMSVFPRLRPELYLLTSIPVIFTGGSCTVFMLLFCYVCDITTIDERALRLAVLQFVYNFGNFFGAVSAPQIFKSILDFPYTSIFMLSSGLLLAAVIYVLLFISESITIREERHTNLIDLENIQKLGAVCFLKRPYHARTMILLIAGTLGITVFIVQGENNVLYLSLRERFGWELENYAFYSSCTMVFNCVGGLVGVYLFITVLEFPVIPMAIAVTLCRTTQAVINSVALNPFYFYISSGVGCLINMLGALTRLEISKLMPQEDLGKIMAFISFLEAICPIIAVPMYTFLYNGTYQIHPEAMFWLSTALSLIPVCFLLTVVILQYVQNDFRYTGLDPVVVQ